MKMSNMLFIFFAVFIISAAHAQTGTQFSCKQLKASGFHLSGLYWINTNVRKIQVYCDMTTDNGGWTYLPTSALAEANLNLSNIFTENMNVLLRIKNKHCDQTYTKITPLGNIPFSVQVSNYTGYTQPKNEHLGSYLFLGILPKVDAQNHGVQGFKSNNQIISFSNCDRNPNSLFAFFPNFHQRNPSTYHHNSLTSEMAGVAVNWRNSAIQSVQQLPDNYFFLTELHFGGCGTYTFSNRWIDAEGTAIGLR